MTEPNAPLAEREIEFRERQIWVKMPLPEQILVWKRTLSRLQEADAQDWNGETVLAALERLRMIIDSVVLHRVDVDWLDDEMLAGRVRLTDTAEIINLTVAAFGEAEPDNRAGRRAAAKKTVPAKKAVRKAAPRSPR